METPVEWKVLNPTAEYETVRYQRAPRLTTLSRKRVGLYWNGKVDGDKLLSALGGLLLEQSRDIQLIKFDLDHPLGPENIKRVAEGSDAVIGATGD